MSSWAGFWSAFAAVFVAEFGDRTQLSILFAASQVDRPWSIVGAAALAFAASCGLAVGAGAALGRWVPLPYLYLGSGVLFVLFGLWFGAVALRRPAEEAEELSLPGRRLVLALAATIFVAELGDKTQLTTGVLGATHPVGAVFAGATAALVVNAALAVIAGRLLRRLPAHLRRWVLPVGASVFLAFGIWYLVRAAREWPGG